MGSVSGPSSTSGTSTTATPGASGTSDGSAAFRAGAGVTNIQGAADLYATLGETDKAALSKLQGMANDLWGKYNTAVRDGHNPQEIDQLRGQLSTAERDLVLQERTAFSNLGAGDQSPELSKQLQDAADRFNSKDHQALFQYSAREPQSTAGTAGASGAGTSGTAGASGSSSVVGLTVAQVGDNVASQLNQADPTRSLDTFGKDLSTWAQSKYNGGSTDTHEQRDQDKAALLAKAGGNANLISQINSAYTNLPNPSTTANVLNELSNHGGDAKGLEDSVVAYAQSRGQQRPVDLTPEQKQELINQVPDGDKAAVMRALNNPALGTPPKA